MEGDDLWSAAVTGVRGYYSKPEVKPQMPPRSYKNNYAVNYVDQNYTNLTRDYSSVDRPRFFAGKKGYDEGQYKYEDTQNYQYPPRKRPNLDYAKRSKFNLTDLKNNQPELSNFHAGNNFNKPPVKNTFGGSPVYDRNKQCPTSQGRQTSGGHIPLSNKNQQFPTSHVHTVGTSNDGKDDHSRYHYNKNENSSSKLKFNDSGNDQSNIVDEHIRQVYNASLTENSSHRSDSSAYGGVANSDERFNGSIRSPAGFQYGKSQGKQSQYYILEKDQQEYGIGLNKRENNSVSVNQNAGYRGGQKFCHTEDRTRGNNKNYYSNMQDKGRDDPYRSPYMHLPGKHNPTIPVGHGDIYRHQDSYNNYGNSTLRGSMTFGGNDLESHNNRHIGEKSGKEYIKQMLIDAGNKSVLSYRRNHKDKLLKSEPETVDNSHGQHVKDAHHKIANPVTSQVVKPLMSQPITAAANPMFHTTGAASANRFQTPFVKPLVPSFNPVGNRLVNPTRMVGPMRYVAPMQYLPRITGPIARPNMPIIIRSFGAIPAGACIIQNPFMNTVAIRPIQGQGIRPITFESEKAKKQRKRLLQDALKQIDARKYGKDAPKHGKNWKGNPKKPWFDYECHLMRQKRVRKYFRLRKVRNRNNIAEIEEVKESIREINREYVPMIRERKSKYLSELEEKGMYEMLCYEVVRTLVDRVVSVIKKEQKQKYKENEENKADDSDKINDAGEVIVIDDDPEDAEVDDENEEIICDEDDVEDMNEYGEEEMQEYKLKDNEVYEMKGEIEDTKDVEGECCKEVVEVTNEDKVEDIKDMIEVEEDLVSDTKDNNEVIVLDKSGKDKNQSVDGKKVNGD